MPQCGSLFLVSPHPAKRHQFACPSQDRREPKQSVVLQLLLKAQAGQGAKGFVVHGAQLALR
jgi:hypothetical protein